MSEKVLKHHGEAKRIGDAGSFEAVIATFGVVDSDGDIIEAGAFNGASAPILPAHDSGSVPLGKAHVEERDGTAVAVGQFNLEVAAARDWHAALKFDLANPPAKQEWSWGFFPTKFRFEEVDGKQARVIEEIDLLEVSPVLRGASVGTRTITAKEKATEADPEAKKEDPEPVEKPGVKLVDQLSEARGAVEAALDRFQDLKASRDRQGKGVSDAASAELIQMATSVADLSREVEELHGLLESLESTVDDTAKPSKVAAALADWTAHKARFGTRT